MTMVSLGDLAQSFMLKRQNAAMKVDLQRLSQELTTGTTSDLAKTVAGDFLPLAGIDTSLARLVGYKSVTQEASLFAGAMQTTLSTIESIGSDLGNDLLTAYTARSAEHIASVGLQARAQLDTVLAAMNTRHADRALFAGMETNDVAVVDASVILMALQTAIAGATTAEAVKTAVSNWFDDPLGYIATAYLGGAPAQPLRIAPGENVSLDITATDPAFRATLKGLAMAALLDQGVLAGAPAARADVARLAGESLLQTQSDRAYLAARLGVAEARIAAAATRNDSEQSALQIARLGITSVDPYDTAAKLEQTQTQLEILYTLTARIGRMTLADYL